MLQIHPDKMGDGCNRNLNYQFNALVFNTVVLAKSLFYLDLARNTEENGHTKYSPKSIYDSNTFGSPPLKTVTEKVLKVTAETPMPYLCLMFPQGEASQLGSVHPSGYFCVAKT